MIWPGTSSSGYKLQSTLVNEDPVIDLPIVSIHIYLLAYQLYARLFIILVHIDLILVK